MWYHFAIMFEAIFILTTLDAGTRVGRFMLQDVLGNVWPRMARPRGIHRCCCRAASSSRMGIFPLYRRDRPNAGLTSCGLCSDIQSDIGAIALCVATGILVKSGKLKFAWITGLPLPGW